MRILHIQFAGPFTEEFNYQENVLPKYHVLQGHEVYFLTTCYAWDKGTLIHVKPERKRMKDGVYLERLDFVDFGIPIITRRLRLVHGVYDKLDEISPDFIMLHDVQSLSDIAIVKYLKKHKNVRMIVDCHTDFSNSARNFISKYFLHGILWRKMAHILEPYTDMFYGVLPARNDFLINMYKLPSEKVKLLVMGADDLLVNNAMVSKQQKGLREKYRISDQDFLIVTGGKIDMFKTQTLLLMEAIKKIDNNQVKLIIFGSIDPRLMERVNELIDGEKIQYIGWIDANDSYDYFAIADLICFPGRHSVFWEQVVGMGIPMLVKYWEGTTHVDCGGNVEFLYEDSVDEIYQKIKKIIENKQLYENMKNIAENVAMKQFLYSNIAQRCLEDNINGENNVIYNI